MMSASLHQGPKGIAAPVYVTAELLDTGTVVLTIGSMATIGEVSIFAASLEDAHDLIDRAKAALNEIGPR